jgi:hypothetical protein
MQVIWWALIAALVIGGGIYAYMEYHAYLLRTSVTTLPTGVRFTAQGLVVESHTASRDVVVQTQRGSYTHQKAPYAQEDSQSGSLTVTFAAVGLKISTSRVVVKPDGGGPPVETGFSTITFQSSDDLTCRAEGRTPGETSSLRIEHIPNAIAHDFESYANRVLLWVDKLEHNLRLDVDKRRKEEEERERAQAQAAAKAKKNASVALTDAEREAKAAVQIEAWREKARFKGSSTEISIDANGDIVWFIDLHPTGRTILHSNKRTFYGSLEGAKVTALTGELEIGVRDDYWTEDDPQLLKFRILAGSTPENRLAWKERLEILIRGLH